MIQANRLATQLIKKLIESNTDKFLESGGEKPINDFIIKYNGHTARIDLEAAELNEQVIYFLNTIIDTMKDYE